MQSFIEPNIHPILVHFAYALSITSILCYLLAGFQFAGRWQDSLRPAADWMLAFAALAIVATIAAGFQAYYSVAHDGPSHAAMTTHRNWAAPSGAAILLLAVWRWLGRDKPATAIFKTLLAAAAISLSVAAWWGGHIVYKYGLGVESLPVVTGDGHDHDHGDGGDDENAPASTQGGHDNSDGHHDGEAAETAPVSSDDDAADSSHDDKADAHDNSDGHHDEDIVSQDDRDIRRIIAEIEKGWEEGDGAPFRKNFLDFEGARYFESGGENTGLNDLVENHVEPEKSSIPDLQLGVSNIQIHYEGDFAWAVGDTTVKGTIVKTGAILDRTGKQTWLFRKVGGGWKVVHTHSSSRAARR